MKSNERFINNQRWMLNYFSNVRILFKKGNIRFKFHKNRIFLNYHQSYLQGGIQAESEIKLQGGSNGSIRDMIYLIQDFIISCYYEFEWDKTPMTLKDISLLMGVNIPTTQQTIDKILKNIKRSFTPKY